MYVFGRMLRVKRDGKEANMFYLWSLSFPHSQCSFSLSYIHFGHNLKLSIWPKMLDEHDESCMSCHRLTKTGWSESSCVCVCVYFIALIVAIVSLSEWCLWLVMIRWRQNEYANKRAVNLIPIPFDRLPIVAPFHIKTRFHILNRSI